MLSELVIILSGLTGLKIAAKNEKMTKLAAKRLERFKRTKKAAVEIKESTTVFAIYILSIAAGSLAISAFLSVPIYRLLQEIFFRQDGVIILNSGQYFIAACLLAISPFILRELFLLLFKVLPVVEYYVSARWLAGQIDLAGLAQGKSKGDLKFLNEIAREYDLKKVTDHRLGMNSLAIIVLILILAPALFFAGNSYLAVSGEGFYQNSIFQLRAWHYNWEDVTRARIYIDEGEGENLVPKFQLDIDDEKIDLWRFGLMPTDPLELERVCGILHENDVRIRIYDLPDISRLPDARKTQVNYIFQSMICDGTIDDGPCALIEEGSELWRRLDCEGE